MKIRHSIDINAWIGSDAKPKVMESSLGETPVARIAFDNIILWFDAKSARTFIETLQSVKWSGVD